MYSRHSPCTSVPTFFRASSALTCAGVRLGEAAAGGRRASLVGALAGRGRRGVDELPLRLGTRPDDGHGGGDAGQTGRVMRETA